jgi:excisionase family DNA binding protein
LLDLVLKNLRLRKFLFYAKTFFMKELLTTQEAAGIKGISDARIRQLILLGKLPAQKFGRSNLIKRKDLCKISIQGKAGRPKKPEVELA